MAQSVVYADLRFVKAPRGNSTCSRSQEAALADEDDAELTYENIRLAQTGEVKRRQGAEQSKEPRWSTWYLPLGLLGACLFLLATTIGLGVRYWQVSQHLQQASRAHEAESSRLSQQVSTKGATLEQTARELEQARRELEQTRRELEQARRELEQARGELEQTRQELEQARGELEQTRRELEQARRDMEQTRQELEQARGELEQTRGELEQTRRELEKMRLEENSTQEKLRQLEAALEGSKEELARVQKEKTEMKEKLNKMESALSSICPCKQTGCCLADLVLYRGKCLFVSKEKKTWEESKEDCEQKSARLLIAKSWDSETTLNFLKNTDVQYWIGLNRNKESPWQWKWVDNSPFKPDWRDQNYYERCGTIRGGVISSDRCNSYYKKPWICEKAASQPSSHGLWFPWSP